MGQLEGCVRHLVVLACYSVDGLVYLVFAVSTGELLYDISHHCGCDCAAVVGPILGRCVFHKIEYMLEWDQPHGE